MELQVLQQQHSHILGNTVPISVILTPEDGVSVDNSYRILYMLILIKFVIMQALILTMLSHLS